MVKALPHPTIDWESPDRPQAYQEFKQMAELWFKVKKVEKKDQHSYIIIWSGREGLRMFNTWGLSDELLKDPKTFGASFQNRLCRQKTSVSTGWS